MSKHDEVELNRKKAQLVALKKGVVKSGENFDELEQSHLRNQMKVLKNEITILKCRCR